MNSPDTYIGKSGRLPKGYGYYATDRYPIGGSFHRAGTHGLHVTVERVFKAFRGTNAEGTTADGQKVAFNLAHVEWESAGAS